MRVRCNNRDITGQIGDLSWSNNIAELATKVTFSIPKIDAKYMNLYYPNLGDPFGLDNGINAEGRFFYGTIIEIDDDDKSSNQSPLTPPSQAQAVVRSDDSPLPQKTYSFSGTPLIKYTVVDWGYDLNKTKIDIQFNDSTFENAIRELIENSGIWGIGIATLIGCNGKFSETYLEKSRAEILDDICDKMQELNGYIYNYDITPAGLRVYRLGDLHAKPTFQLSANTNVLDSTLYKGEVSHKTELDGKETFSCTIIDKIDGYVRAGEEIEIDGAKYIIHSAEHTIEDGWQKVKLGLEAA